MLHTTISGVKAPDIQDRTATSQGKILQEGSSVFFKVLSKTNKNTYTISLGGQQYQVHSNEAFPLGKTFKAKVQYHHQGIILKIKNSEIPLGLVSISENINFENPEVISYFSELGLPANKTSLSIIHYFQQRGLKLDKNLLQRIFRTIQKLGKNSKSREEIITHLEAQNIEPTEEFIQLLLQILQGDFENSNNHQKNLFSENNKNTDLFTLFNNFSSIENLEQNQFTFLNHYAPDESHWIILPFSFEINEKEYLQGCIRFLVDKKTKSTKKMCIFAISSLKSYFFDIYYKRKSEKNVVDSIFLCQKPSLNKTEQEVFISKIKDFFNQDVSISYKENLSDSSFFSISDEIYLVKDFV
ncbi:MAG: hypothetical protein E7062_01195 [Spirochaetaceae bacterium]|nr:hypothetical protein [Spirochaetaceae bacterium]